MVDDPQMGRVGVVEVISSKGCSRLFTNNINNNPTTSSSSINAGLQSFSLEPPSPSASESTARVRLNGPFSGLVICVTGLSKEARKQVMEATKRLGGEYSPDLHPQCTHLVVQSFHGQKFEHAVKHGSKNGFYVVTLGWFVDSVRRNVRLSESLYSIRFIEDVGASMDDLNQLIRKAGTQKSCLPSRSLDATDQCVMIEGRSKLLPDRELKRRNLTFFRGHSFYIDEQVSAELKNKVAEAVSMEGAILVDNWFVGCGASHVVCEGSSARKYLGHSSTIVSPLWVLKTVKENHVQRLVHLSADLARQTGAVLETIQNGINQEVNTNICLANAPSAINKVSSEVRQQIANHAKDGVRQRRGRRMQTCQTPIRPITAASLLDSICWSISQPTSTASIYTDSSSVEDANEVSFDAADREGKESDISFINMTRALTESEKSELIFKSHFLTILFPVDRFSEMGPCSRTFFGDKGFTCLQVLDYIYSFYQENMSAEEIELAIQTDSRHADRLRTVYAGLETSKHDYVKFKRIDFLGSRKSFEMLKRVSGDNNSNVYELLLRA